MAFSLPSLGGYDSVLPEGALRSLRVVEGAGLDEVLKVPYRTSYRSWFLLTKTRLDLLARLGVTHLVVAPGTRRDPRWPRRVSESGLTLLDRYAGTDGEVYEIADEAPGLPVVCAALPATGEDEALRQFLAPGFRHREQVVLDAASVGSAPPAAGCQTRAARVTSSGVNRLALEFEPGGGWLVVAQNWDPGWRAWADGQPVPVLRANAFQQAIALPAAARAVRMEYWPVGLSKGLLGFATAALGLVAAALVRFAGRRRSAGG
jgi:hypothetical protein